MSSLMERSFGSVQDLNRYRKELTRALEQRMNEKMQALAPNDAKPASV
ncbi:ferritin-like domain-containing protein, partial [Halobacillus litoralis]|nr:ferritin-like domain-containing protein [Halobacillus litoralis]